MNDPGNTTPRRSLEELQQEAADAGGLPDDGRVPYCPNCGRRLFYVTSTWRTKDGKIRRLRKCSACGYAANSTEVNDGQ